MRYLVFILLIISIGCQSFNKKKHDYNGEKLDSTFITKLIGNNIEYTKGVTLTKELQDEFIFLNYFNFKYNKINYIYQLGYIPDIDFELFYNSKFFTQSVTLTKKTIDDDGEKYRTFIYRYDESGKIKSITNAEENYLSYKFKYFNNNLNSLIENNISEPISINNEHYNRPKSPNKYTKESKLEYLDNKIISNKSQSLIFSQSIVNPTKTLIKAEVLYNDGRRHLSLSGRPDGEYSFKIIYCFENGKCQFIAVYNINGIYPGSLLLFDNNGTAMTIKTYLNYNSDKGTIFALRAVTKIQKSVDYKLERLTEILSPMQDETHSIKDYSYRYNYSKNNILLGYDVYLDKYLSSENEKNILRKTDYKLIEQIYSVN